MVSAIVPIPRLIVATIIIGGRIVIIRGWGWIIIRWGSTYSIPESESWPGKTKAPMTSLCGSGG
jgi:hypothetical protein